MDATAQSAPWDSEIIIECCHGCRRDSTAQTTPRDSDIMNETAATGDGWI